MNRKLDVFWLSNNKFTDLTDLKDIIAKAWVPEIDLSSYRAKKLFLSTHNIEPSIVIGRHPQTAREMLLAHRSENNVHRFDVINLDFCSHLSVDTVDTLGMIARLKLIEDEGLLFVTVSQVSRSNKLPDTRHKSVARTLIRADEIIRGEMNRNGISLEPLDGFPFEYITSAKMHSLGWRISYQEQ